MVGGERRQLLVTIDGSLDIRRHGDLPARHDHGPPILSVDDVRRSQRHLGLRRRSRVVPAAARRLGAPVSVEFAVIICAHDERRWERLCCAVRSVQEQTLPPREVVIAVDHNRDLLDRARGAFTTLAVVENSEARGLRGARNSGLRAATSPHVAFLDDDAEASARWLEILAGSYDDPDVAGVGGSTSPVWDGGRPTWFPHEFDWVVGSAYRGMPLRRQEVRNLWGGNMSFRRDLILEIGGFRIGYSCDDTELCIRLRQRWPEKRFVLVPEAQVAHHVDRSRLTVRRFLSRCYFEGGSKAVISRLVGAQDALASERQYAREVLPRGVRQELVEFLTGRNRAAIARAGMILAGLASTTAGYGVGQFAPARAAAKRGWDGPPLASRVRRARVQPKNTRCG